MTWNKVQGSQTEIPPEIEIGETTAFIRKDIERVTLIDPITEQEYEVWEYLEVKVPKEDTASIIEAVQEQSAEKIHTNTDELEAQAEAIEELAEIIVGLE